LSNLDVVTLVVRDYDAAIRFFVDILQFRLVEDWWDVLGPTAPPHFELSDRSHSSPQRRPKN
jgi:catechol 2,3-dioxygenase-like lactoylglutathione lyase family enzyme